MRIGKCKECNGELWRSGYNWNGWRQHTCSRCKKVYGGTFEEFINGELM